MCACSSDDGDDGAPPPFVAVVSAFPAELAPLLAQATVDSTMMVGGHVFRLGTLGGVRVALGLVGMGLVNAAATTHAVLEQLPVTGVVMSAVAGSPLRIADVTVPVSWSLIDGTPYPANRQWLDLAREIAAPGVVTLEHCTIVPSVSTVDPVCLPFEPAIVVGGAGQSSDPYKGNPAPPCAPKGNDVFGCDVPAASTASGSGGDGPALRAIASVDQEAPIAVDMETAAVAAEAAARGVPFIAFRAVSDGAEDPLGLPGFPTQFFAYYHLAADNAAAATVAFLERIAAGGAR